MQSYFFSSQCHLSYVESALKLNTKNSTSLVYCPEEQRLLINLIDLWKMPHTIREIFDLYPRTSEVSGQILAGIDFLIKNGFVAREANPVRPVLREWFFHL